MSQTQESLVKTECHAKISSLRKVSDRSKYKQHFLFAFYLLTLKQFIDSTYHYELWKKQTKQINDFIRKKELTSLTVGENNASVVFTSIYLIFVVIAISIIIWSIKINLKYTLSKKTNTLSIARYNRFTQTTREIALDKIKNVVLEKSEGIEDMTSRIVFKLKSGEDVPLTSWLDSFDGKDEVIKCIRQFLK